MATESHHLNRRSLASCALLVTLLLFLPAPRTHSAIDPEQLEGRVPTKVELVASVEAAFPRESYRPGSVATLRIFNRARGITMQLFRVGPETVQTRGHNEMQGVPVSGLRAIHGRLVTV